MEYANCHDENDGDDGDGGDDGDVDDDNDDDGDDDECRVPSYHPALFDPSSRPFASWTS